MSNIFDPLYKSLYSGQFYCEAAFNKTGNGLGFISILALIRSCIITGILAITCGFLLFMSEQKQDSFLAKVPVMTIANGELSIDQPSPYYFLDDSNKIGRVVIDTEHYNQNTDYEIFKLLDDNKLLILATKTKIYSHDPQKNEYKVYNLSDYSKVSSKPLIIDSDTIKHWLKLFSIFFIPLMGILMFASYFIIMVIEMLIYSIGGLIFNGIMRRNLAYDQIQRLCAYSLWPGLIVSTISLLPHLHVHWVASVLVTLGYIFFAVQSSTANHQAG